MSKPNSSLGRSRDLGIPNANGKGSADRVTDGNSYRENYDEIDWGPKLPSRDETVDKFVINPAWVAAGAEANIVFCDFKCHDTGPLPVPGPVTTDLNADCWDR